MNRLLLLGTALIAPLAAALFVQPALADEPNKLLNASYDVARELFVAENEAFIKQHPGVTIDQSHAGTSKQARSIVEGLEADVVTFNQSTDIDFLAKQGFVDRLVTYNPGINKTFLYTTHQDYWAGEMSNLKSPAKSRYLDNGLQWFGWTCLDDRRWVHSKTDTPIPGPLYRVDEIVAFVRACNSVGAPMTFNVGIHQDGTLAPESVERLRKVRDEL